MGRDESPERAAAGKTEKRWFQRTVGFTAGLFIGLLLGGGAQYWTFVKLTEIFPTFATTRSVSVMTGSAEAEALEVALYAPGILTLAARVVMLICAIGFLVSLVKWLLAIGNRRALHAAGFAPPGEPRDSGLERAGKGK